MKKETRNLALAVIATAIIVTANNFAMSGAISDFRFAVVDVQKVVTSSTQVKAIAEERAAKVKDLQNFIEKAKAEILAEKDQAKKKEIEDRSNKELNIRKNAIDKDYAQKVAAVDTLISQTISKEAKSKNYNLVLTKGVVLFGGDDITDAITKAVK